MNKWTWTHFECNSIYRSELFMLIIHRHLKYEWTFFKYIHINVHLRCLQLEDAIQSNTVVPFIFWVFVWLFPRQLYIIASIWNMLNFMEKKLQLHKIQKNTELNIPKKRERKKNSNDIPIQHPYITIVSRRFDLSFELAYKTDCDCEWCTGIGNGSVDINVECRFYSP